MIDVRPVVLAGGSGARLWPWSRLETPKQFVSLVDEHSLLQHTVARLRGIVPGGVAGTRAEGVRRLDCTVVCGDAQADAVLADLDAIGEGDVRLVVEPCARSTAPAIVAAALLDRATGADPVLAVLPSDHFVGDDGAYVRALTRGAEIAAGGAIVTFGVTPDRPETGYGYLRLGEALAPDDPRGPVYAMDGFVEKPDAVRAGEFLASGRHLWNSGVFMARASVWLEAVGRCLPEMVAHCTAALGAATSERGHVHLDASHYARCPSQSIDYALMEHLGTGEGTGEPPVRVVPLPLEWSDLGSWAALGGLTAQLDARGNYARGDVRLDDVDGCVAMSASRLVAMVGVSNLVVAETDDAVLVAPLERSQDVRRVVEWLEAEDRPEWTGARRSRPAGARAADDPAARTRTLVLAPGEALRREVAPGETAYWVVTHGAVGIVGADRSGDGQVIGAGEGRPSRAAGWHTLGTANDSGAVLVELRWATATATEPGGGPCREDAPGEATGAADAAADTGVRGR